MSTCTFEPMVRTGPLHTLVWHPVALPWLPSRTGFVTPDAGLMVIGAEDDVPEVATDQLPT